MLWNKRFEQNMKVLGGAQISLSQQTIFSISWLWLVFWQLWHLCLETEMALVWSCRYFECFVSALFRMKILPVIYAKFEIFTAILSHSLPKKKKKKNCHTMLCALQFCRNRRSCCYSTLTTCVVRWLCIWNFCGNSCLECSYYLLILLRSSSKLLRAHKMWKIISSLLDFRRKLKKEN